MTPEKSPSAARSVAQSPSAARPAISIPKLQLSHSQPTLSLGASSRGGMSGGQRSGNEAIEEAPEGAPQAAAGGGSRPSTGDAPPPVPRVPKLQLSLSHAALPVSTGDAASTRAPPSSSGDARFSQEGVITEAHLPLVAAPRCSSRLRSLPRIPPPRPSNLSSGQQTPTRRPTPLNNSSRPGSRSLGGLGSRDGVSASSAATRTRPSLPAAHRAQLARRVATRLMEASARQRTLSSANAASSTVQPLCTSSCSVSYSACYLARVPIGYRAALSSRRVPTLQSHHVLAYPYPSYSLPTSLMRPTLRSCRRSSPPPMPLAMRTSCCCVCSRRPSLHASGTLSARPSRAEHSAPSASARLLPTPPPAWPLVAEVV